MVISLLLILSYKILKETLCVVQEEAKKLFHGDAKFNILTQKETKIVFNAVVKNYTRKFIFNA